MTNIYYYSDLGSAQRDGVHINESHKGEKGPTYTRYNGVERNISRDEEKACAIIVACALAVLTLGIIFIFSPDFRANLFGRNVVTVNVEDPKEKTAAKTDDAAQNKIPKAPFDINGASIFDIHARFLDEIGRGTSTYDGLSIAWAVAEYISDKEKCGAKTVFATHYHELIGLEDKLEGVKNYSVAVKEKGEDVIFLRKIVSGGTSDLHINSIFMYADLVTIDAERPKIYKGQQNTFGASVTSTASANIILYYRDADILS